MMTAETLRDSLATSYSGRQIVYWTGLLMQVCERSANVHIRELRQVAWDAYEAGRCELVQRRVSPGVCDYIAIVR